MKLDLLAIAPHPDDVELTCGGTLIKMAQQGYQVGVLDLTRGEMGTRGTPEIRRREAETAARVMGLAVRGNLGLPDAGLEVNQEYKLAVARKIREWQPRTVIVPYWTGRHPDHYTASRLSYEGCFLAGLKRLPIEGEPFRPFKMIYAAAYDENAQPTLAVDITAQYNQRRRAILAYKSQFQPVRKDRKSKVFIPLDALEERMSVMAQHYGRMIDVKYAEGFVVREIAQVEDVVALTVRSL